MRRAAPAIVLTAALAVTACGPAASAGARASKTATGSPAASASASASATASALSPLVGPAAGALLEQAYTDTKAAPSLRMEAAGMADGGQQVSYDLTSVQGAGCEGTISGSNRGTLQLVLKGGYIWAKPSGAFLTSMHLTQLQLAAIGSKWFKVKSTDSQLADVAQLCNVPPLFRETAANSATVLSGIPATYQGKSVYEFNIPGAGDVYVSDSATPTLVKLIEPGSGGAAISFTTFSTALPITAPPLAETIDGSQVGF